MICEVAANPSDRAHAKPALIALAICGMKSMIEVRMMEINR